MKNITILLLLVLVSCTSTEKFSTKEQSDGHNSYNSLDWEGFYIGTEPCKDCEKIERKIYLFEDMSYEVVTEYIGSDKPLIMRHEGQFEWSKDGGTIVLKNDDANLGTLRYKVGENVLIPLDTYGEAVKYDTRYTNPVRENSVKLLKKEWVLLELNGRKVEKNASDDGKTAILNFDTDGRIFGNSGCNNFSGGYSEHSNYELEFGTIASTRMMCQNMKIEDEYLKIFSNKVQYQIELDTLNFRDKNNVIIAKFVK